jgi:hypothetical protein
LVLASRTLDHSTQGTRYNSIDQRGRAFGEYAYLVLCQPILSLVCLLLIEGFVDCAIAIVASVLEFNLVTGELLEVLLCLLCRTGTETLVILDLPTDTVVCFALPSLILGDRVERSLLLTFGALQAKLQSVHVQS